MIQKIFWASSIFLELGLNLSSVSVIKKGCRKVIQVQRVSENMPRCICYAVCAVCGNYAVILGVIYFFSKYFYEYDFI